MPEDSSLTEFIETDDDQSPESADDDTGESTDADTVTITFAWSGDGDGCADCGETVARRWTDDGRLVCADCKRW